MVTIPVITGPNIKRPMGLKNDVSIDFPKISDFI